MTAVLEHESVQETPPAPRRRLRSFLPAARTFVVSVLLIGGAGAGGAYVVTHRLAQSAFVTLDDAMLTARPLPIGSTGAGVVTDVQVTELTRVVAGQVLARVRLAADPSRGREPQVETLRAPMAGTVSTIDVALGGVVDAGEPVVTLYDHTGLAFRAKVSEKQLRGLRLGMAARISGPGLGAPVPATLDHVEPRVGPDPLTDAPLSEEQKAALEKLTVVFVPDPADVGRVSRLVPGLRFAAEVDTDTAAGRTPAVNSAG